MEGNDCWGNIQPSFIIWILNNGSVLPFPGFPIFIFLAGGDNGDEGVIALKPHPVFTLKIFLYMYLACLSVCSCPINVKTAEPITVFDLCKSLKMREQLLWIFEPFLLLFYTVQREDAHI